MDDFDATVAKFAHVSGMSTAETAVVLADALNVFGDSASQAANIMNQAAASFTGDAISGFAGRPDELLADEAVFVPKPPMASDA